MRLHPIWSDESARAAVRDQWKRSGGSLRIAPFLDPEFAEDVRNALDAQPFELAHSHVGMYQYFRTDPVFDPDCDHPLCAVGRWLHGDGCAWTGDVTDQPLAPPENQPYVTGNLYTKGSYLDVHNDFGKGRAVAYVLGFTRESWPAAEGGWLEFLAEREGSVLESRPPGWNTLDLFDVREPTRWHRVPMVRDHLARVTISGWFYPLGGPP